MSTGKITVGVLHPGEMGAVLGAALRDIGHDVVWASSGRSGASILRAQRADLDDAGTVVDLERRSDVIISVCPPHAALDVVRSLSGSSGIVVDANAISPGLTRRIGELVERGGRRYVDGGIVGPPPTVSGTTRLYLSGAAADEVAAVFEGSRVEARVVSEQVGAASALKMAYAAWTKGTAALVLAIQAAARAEAVEDALLEEWAISQPDLSRRSAAATRSASANGWRWSGEMLEIAATFASVGLPDGFHLAAAEVFARVERGEHTPDEVIDQVMAGVPTSRSAEVRLPKARGGT